MKRSLLSSSHWCLRVILVLGLLAATGLAATPTAASAPRGAPVAHASAATHRADVTEGRTDGQGRDDDDANEADGVSQTEDSIVDDIGLGGGVSNMVKLNNHQDGRLRVRGNVDLNRIYGQRVAPRNIASATASCTGCQTVVVALQLNLYKRTATDVEPLNLAEAYNIECSHCATVAYALQYDIPVDDPQATPPDVDELIREMDQELQEIHAGHRTTTDEAEARLNDIIARFTALGDSLNKQRAASTAQNDPMPSVTGTPTATLAPTVSPTADAGASAASNAALDATPTATSPTASSSTAPGDLPTPTATTDTSAAPASSPRPLP